MSVLEALVGFIAPPECLACGQEGSALCAACSQKFIKPFGQRCWRCNRLSQGSRTCDSCRSAGGPSRVFISTSYEGVSQRLIQNYKFGHERIAAKPIANQMIKALRDGNLQLDNYLVIPVPTATSRVRQRGFGHSELLAGRISNSLGARSVTALRRLGQSRQLGAKREDRLRQLDGKFSVRLQYLVSGRKILLVDDVLTTGGTLIAAAKALRAAGAAQVDALVFAKRL